MIEFAYKDENRQWAKFELDIDFISRGIRDMINRYLGDLVGYKRQFDKISDNQTEISALKTEKPDGYKDKIKQLEHENKSLYESLQDIKTLERENEGILLIKRILKDNGIFPEHKMYSDDFWINDVNPGSIISFLSKCWGLDAAEAAKNQKKNVEQTTA